MRVSRSNDRVVWSLALFVLLSVASASVACSGSKGRSDGTPVTVLEGVEPLKEGEMKKARKYFIENVGGIALVQLYADDFEKLSLKEKLLAYYLYQATVAGRNITYDQNHRHALALRYLVDQVVTHPLGLRPEVEDAFRHYAKLLWLNNGPYYERTKTKIVPPFTLDEMLEALGVARANGADFAGLGRPLEQVVNDVEPLLFDPFFETKVTNKSPGKGADILSGSANNYYLDVTLEDLEGFEEKHPLNSRLTKVCPKRKPCGLEEQVYRTGVKDARGRKWVVKPGLYASELEKVNHYLEKALEYAVPGQDEAISHLIEFFKTGDPASFDQASIAWLRVDPEVDFILGFIETYKDARGQKGEFEGLVYYKDITFSTIMRGIADNAGYFENKAPWDEKYKKAGIRVPVAAAINVLAGMGGAGPNIPAGINLPNAQWIREKHGSRSVLLSNVISAARFAVSDKALDEFALAAEIPAVKKYRDSVGRTMVALHEIVGHGSGKASDRLTQDPSYYLKETYSTLEEARAELVALHHVFDPKLIEIGAIPNEQAATVAYADYLRGDLLQLRRVKEGSRFEDDHMRAIHLIVQYLMRNDGGAEIHTEEGKTYYILTDISKARPAVAHLLAEVMRIKAEGDLAAARQLIDTYGIEFDPALRDEVVKRAAAAGVPDFVAFQIPSMKLVYNDFNEPVDVMLDYSKDFMTMMLEWDIMGVQ